MGGGGYSDYRGGRSGGGYRGGGGGGRGPRRGGRDRDRDGRDRRYPEDFKEPDPGTPTDVSDCNGFGFTCYMHVHVPYACTHVDKNFCGANYF